MIEFLKEQIKDGFEPAMESFVKSEDYRVQKWETERAFLELRSELSPEQAKKLNGLMNARDDQESVLALESYFRGVVHGIGLRDDAK